MKRLHRERDKRTRDNPIIGYHVVDWDYRVIGPPGTRLDPAFDTEARALEAAAKWGRRAEVRMTVPLHLEGLLGVLQHGGDIVLDGAAAQRPVEACRRRGIRINQRISETIHADEAEAVYSSRAIVAE